MRYRYPEINLSDYPHLLREWSDRNTFDINRLKKSYEYIWVCPNEHIYRMKLVNRIDRGLKCPYCAGQRVLIGYNDVATTDPWIIERFSADSPVQPEDVTRGSRKKAIFVCSLNHEYEQMIKNAIILQRGCPYCSGHFKKKGYNDLQTMLPEIAEEYSLSNTIPVDEIWAVSSEKYRRNVEWICRNNKNHIWESSLYHRISEKQTDACPYCRGLINEKGFNDLETLHPLLKEEWSTKNEKPLSDYTYQSCYRAFWECAQGHEWKAYIFHRTTGKGKCKICFPQTSEQENEMYKFLQSFLQDDDIIRNDRQVLEGKELDFYFPEKKIAIEMNGVYWHSEKFNKDKNYHYDKWKQCQDMGIQLITIWEDEWLYKQDIVKSTIMSKLGISQDTKIPARKTTFELISSKNAKDFANLHHIQGGVDGKFNYALKHNDEIVAVAIFSKTQGKENSFNLLRFCSSKIIQGGFTKMLKNFVKEQECVEEIITFSDNCKSNGSLYNSNGFTVDSEIKPDYSYVKNLNRVHKFNFRKANFKSNKDLLFEDDMTESELAALNNLHRIWDCGKIKWKLSLSKIAI